MVNVTIGIDGALSVLQGDMIANQVEEKLIQSIPNVKRVHVHYHPANKRRENMTIDQLLQESHKYTSPYHPEYYE